MDARKTEAEAELVRPGCWGQLMERLDTFSRRFRPKCRRAVKSQVEIQKLCNVCMYIYRKVEKQKLYT